MSNSEKSTSQLKRWQLNFIYGVEVCLLVYLLIGAISGETVIFGKGGTAVLRGWAAWIACPIPVFLFAYFFALHDSRFGLFSKRRPVAYFFIFLTIVAAIAAGLWNPQRP